MKTLGHIIVAIETKGTAMTLIRCDDKIRVYSFLDTITSRRLQR